MGTDADDRFANLALVHVAAFGHNRRVDSAIVGSCAGQEPRMRIDWKSRVKKIKGRAALRELNVGIVKRPNGADVCPVAAIDVRVDDMVRERFRNDLLSEIHSGLVEDLE